MKSMALNSLLAVVFGSVLLIARLLKAFWPELILPGLSIPGMAAITLLILLIEYYLINEPKRHWIAHSILAAITFGLLPYAAGVAAVEEIWNLALCGGIVFGSVGCLFTFMTKRMEVMLVPKRGAVPMAFVLFLAYQGFAGMVF